MKYEIEGLHHVQLAAPKGTEEEIRAFYGGLLGLREVAKPATLQKNGGVWFECGTHRLHIGVEAEFRPAKKGHPAIQVRGLRAFRTALEERGVTTVDAEPIPGADRFYIADPFGNRIELIEW
ncbi:VOC family protein [Alicyclobacillus dauci]|uniref:VOC family protein n=1 Tax=Alicyclobacillus dauci TaxID=1475485 RepID=A0ABY6Z869_9BACL|nr:VOC family protein [Alicyclobacillus dauci]WAH38366.1 VOC family protein [Alicyclobacillus dauci]